MLEPQSTVLFVLLINLSFHRPVLESFLFAVALAALGITLVQSRSGTTSQA